MRALKSVVVLGLVCCSFAMAMWAFPKTNAGGSNVRSITSDSVWETVDKSVISAASWHEPDSYRALRLKPDALRQLLAGAPMEGTGDLRKSSAVIALPMPGGSFQHFHIEESPVLDTELVAAYPEIKSYRGQGIEDETATVRFDWTPLGLHALILSADHRAVNIQPPNSKDTTVYASYYDQGFAFKCGTKEVREYPQNNVVRRNTAVGTTLRTERLAVAADWEFCNTIGGDTVAGTIAAINAYLNATNAIYEREVSVHMNLVNATNIIYASNNNVCGPGHNVACNSGNDPYTDTDESTMLNEVPPDLRDKVGQANFDVGHVLGTGGAGIAGLGIVCDNSNFNGPRKGAGASRIFGPPGNSSAVGLWAHELGHQHGANHSFNGTMDFCGPSRSASTAWEPGSGTTLMSYAGICATDNLVNNTELRFHNGSYNEIIAYLTASGGCATTSATGDSIPTVSAGTARTIPKLTPFILTATGNDADAADVPNLRYVWEQIDAGGAAYANPPYGDQVGDPASTTRPLFRAFSPVPSSSRTFPSLTYILNNANIPPATVGGFQTAESLPAVSRTMNFRATIRDQRFGVNDSAVAITVDGNSGPFAVTAPNGGGTLSGAQNVMWSVNGTSAAPVNAANVKISLSLNGGNSFPRVLAASVPNTGAANVPLPNGIVSSTARVKVEAVGNIFFDVSDANFTLTPGDGCPAISGFNPNAGNAGNTVTITGVNFTGVNAVTFSNNVPATSFNVDNSTQITATIPNGAVGGPVTLSKPGCGTLQTTTNFSVCPSPPIQLLIDDGSVNSASSLGSGAYYVNRLTPASYPATVKQVAIFWDPFQNFPAGTAITVLAGANPGGTTNIDGTTFQTLAATAGAQPGFTNYNLPNAVTITSGDFVVGFFVPTAPGGSFAVAVDTNTPQSRSYRSGNGTAFTNVTNGNYMIRASQVLLGCDGGLPSLKIVSTTRSNGRALLQCIGVPNVVNNLQASPDLSAGSFTTVVPAPDAADSTGLFLYEDIAAIPLTKRFYRIVYP